MNSQKIPFSFTDNNLHTAELWILLLCNLEIKDKKLVPQCFILWYSMVAFGLMDVIDNIG